MVVRRFNIDAPSLAIAKKRVRALGFPIWDEECTTFERATKHRDGSYEIVCQEG